MPTTWTSTDLWECEDCGAILGLAQIKIKPLKEDPSIRDKTKEAFCEDLEWET